MPELEKIVGLMFQSGGDILQAVKQVQNRLARVNEIRARGGEIGPLFWSLYVLPQYLYRVFLGVAAGAGILAVLGAVLKITDSGTGVRLQNFFENDWLIVFGAGVLLLLIALIDGISLAFVLLLGWMPSEWLPSVFESPEWFNLKEFTNLLEKPRPLALRELGIETVADIAIRKLMSTDYKTNNFAEKPNGLSDGQRANAAIFGCLLEQEHYIRRWARREWRPFYEALSVAHVNGTNIFDPAFLISTRRAARDFYSIIRETVNPRLIAAGQLPLEDTAAVSEDVMNVADTLAAKYQGAASNLAVPDVQGLDLRLAFDRLSEFKHLSGPGMGPQFLKLAVRWDVWPSIKTGNFVYPFSISVAALFLDCEAIVTLGDVEELSFSSAPEQTMVRETMRRTVDTVRRLLTSVDRPEYKSFYGSLRNSPEHPAEWELAQCVDFVLWSHAAEEAKKNTFASWRIGSNKFLKRKKSVD